MSVSASSTPDPSGKWPLFSVDVAGLVLSPVAGRNTVLCSYPYDGGTNELSIGFGVSAKFMPMERKTAVTRGY